MLVLVLLVSIQVIQEAKLRRGFPWWSKEDSAPSAGDWGSIPGQRTRFHMRLHAETKSSHATCCNEDLAQPNKFKKFFKEALFLKRVISIWILKGV